MDGDLDDRALLLELIAHLAWCCEDCRRAWREAARSRVPGRGLLAEWHHSATIEGVCGTDAVDQARERVLKVREEVFSVEAARAPKLLQSLLAFPVQEQVGVVQRTRTKYVSLALAQLLLESAHKVRVCDPRESKRLAALAREVVKKGQSDRVARAFGKDLLGTAKALEGNASRLFGEYREAEACFDSAHRILETGSGDPIVFAELLSYRVSLLLDQVQLDQAKVVAGQAISIFQKAGEDHQAGTVLIKKGLIEAGLGVPAQAVKSLGKALELLDAERDPQMVLITHKNLALYIGEAGDPARGLEVLEKYRSEEHTPERIQIFHTWIEGKMRAKLGEYEVATAALESVRNLFAEQGDAPNAAAATLDLALIHAKAGQLEAVQRVALEALPLLLPLDIPDAALAPLILLEETARAQAVTVTLLQRLQRKLAEPLIWRKGEQVN